jgi:molybdenum cofactor cytidylyltransferase
MLTNGIIVAAGLSSRMHDFKPLLPLQGKTMIEHSVDSMLSADVEQIVVVVGHRGLEVATLLYDRYGSARVTLAKNEAYESSDMLASVKIGIRALRSCEAFYLLPGDMPAIGAATFLALKEAWRKEKVMLAFPCIGGRRKHPPLISQQCSEVILRYDGDGGLRELWRQWEKQSIAVEVNDQGCMFDADTALDYRRLCAYMAAQSV